MSRSNHAYETGFIRRFFSDSQQIFEDMLWDVKIEEMGFEKLRAVDFSEVFTYIHTLRSPTTARESYLKELFEQKVTPLVFLPTWFYEFLCHLDKVRSGLVTFSSLHARIRENYDTVFALPEVNAFFEACKENDHVKAIQLFKSGLWGKLRLLRMNQRDDLLMKPLTKFLNLVDNEILIPVHDALGIDAYDAAELSDCFERVHKLLARARPWRSKEEANYIDAVSICMIKYINDRISSDRKFMSALSDSYHTVAASRQIPWKLEPSGETTNLARRSRIYRYERFIEEVGYDKVKYIRTGLRLARDLAGSTWLTGGGVLFKLEKGRSITVDSAEEMYSVIENKEDILRAISTSIDFAAFDRHYLRPVTEFPGRTVLELEEIVGELEEQAHKLLDDLKREMEINERIDTTINEIGNLSSKILERLGRFMKGIQDTRVMGVSLADKIREMEARIEDQLKTGQ